MADTNTPTYHFVLPEVGASDDTWGTKLNNDFTLLENLLKTAFNNGDPTDLGRLKASHAPLMYDTPLVFAPAGEHIRMKQSDTNDNGYGAILQSDATYMRFLLTNLDDASGPINALRPFDITKATGLVVLGNGVRVIGTLEQRTDGTTGYRLMSANGATERMFLLAESGTNDITLRRGDVAASLKLEADGDIRAAAGQFAGSGAGLTSIPISALPTDSTANDWVRNRVVANSSAFSVGNTIMAYYVPTGSDTAADVVRSGTNLRLTNVGGGVGESTTLLGSWKCMGSAPQANSQTRTTNWFRIS